MKYTSLLYSQNQNTKLTESQAKTFLGSMNLRNTIDLLEIMRVKEFVVTQGSAIKVLPDVHNLN